MPCCAPRYGALIVAGIDLLTGITGLIFLTFGLDSGVVLVCVTFPALILTVLGVTLAFAFIKRNKFLTTAALALKLILVLGCGVIIVVLWSHPYFKVYIYTPVLIAALCYTIILQLHFSWVVYDFRSRACNKLYTGNIQRRFQYVQVEGNNTHVKKVDSADELSLGWRRSFRNTNRDSEDETEDTESTQTDCVI